MENFIEITMLTIAMFTPFVRVKKINSLSCINAVICFDSFSAPNTSVKVMVTTTWLQETLLQLVSVWAGWSSFSFLEDFP